MAIKGSGIDIVEIERIGGMIAKYGDHFLDKVFTAAEVTLCRRAAQPAIHFAGRWAAKEAFYKALPDTCQAVANWHSVEILSAELNRRPIMTVLDRSLAEMMARSGIERAHVSISHEKTHCVAMVVME